MPRPACKARDSAVSLSSLLHLSFVLDTGPQPTSVRTCVFRTAGPNPSRSPLKDSYFFAGSTLGMW